MALTLSLNCCGKPRRASASVGDSYRCPDCGMWWRMVQS